MRAPHANDLVKNMLTFLHHIPKAKQITLLILFDAPWVSVGTFRNRNGGTGSLWRNCLLRKPGRQFPWVITQFLSHLTAVCWFIHWLITSKWQERKSWVGKQRWNDFSEEVSGPLWLVMTTSVGVWDRIKGTNCSLCCCTTQVDVQNSEGNSLIP